MKSKNIYPDNFRYRESHWEGDHTSYSWQKSRGDDKIIGETEFFYVVRIDGKEGRRKKTTIRFDMVADFPER